MKKNLKIIKDFYDAFKKQDKDGYLQLCDEHIEWNVLEGFPNGGKYLGKNAVFEQYFPDMLSNFTKFQAEVDEFLCFENKVVVFGLYLGKSKNGKEFKAPFSHVYTLQNNKITKFNQYTDTAIIQKAIS